jgi:hypothetical protein
MDAAPRGYGSVIIRVVELHDGPASPSNTNTRRRQRSVTLRLDGTSATTSQQLEGVWIEQFVLPVSKPKSGLVVEVHEKGRLFSSTLGRFVLRLEALEMEKLVEDGYRFEQGQLAAAGASLRLILLKTTLSQLVGMFGVCALCVLKITETSRRCSSSRRWGWMSKSRCVLPRCGRTSQKQSPWFD